MIGRTKKAHDAELPVAITTGSVVLNGNLVVPVGARGVVVFAHGSGSSRHSPRNRYVARILQEGGLATLLFDLLTSEEEEIDEQTAQFRFDIDLLIDRLIGAIDWLAQYPETSHLSIGCFGASTGAAAALGAAAARPMLVRAVVSRGGRPDLAFAALSRVQAPTLLIVGGNDPIVLDLNRKAQAQLPTLTKLAIIPGATHLFEEPGALEEMARLAGEWFMFYLAGTAVDQRPGLRTTRK